MIEQVRKHINKDKEKTTLNDVKLALGKLKLNKYVENIIYVHHVISGTPLPYIRKGIEDKMVRLFKQLDRVFGLVRGRVPFARTSFLNYFYVLFKLLDSLLQHELLPRVP